MNRRHLPGFLVSRQVPVLAHPTTLMAMMVMVCAAGSVLDKRVSRGS